MLARQAILGGAPIGLSNREFELLVFLVRHKNVAVTRAILAILENCQESDGSVVIPDVLRPWVGKDRIMPRAK